MYYPVQLGEASNEIYLASTIREIQVSECSDKGEVTQTTFSRHLRRNDIFCTSMRLLL